MLLTDEEFELLLRLRRGGEIPKEKREIAHCLASLGIIRLGYDDEEEPFCETGCLTILGRLMLHEECIARNPFRRMLAGLLSPL